MSATVPSDRLAGAASTPAIAARLNVALSLGIAGLHLAVLIALPLLPGVPMAGVAVLVVALLSNLHWSLVHEAVHGILHPRARVNAALGRALAIVFGAPFAPLRFWHLRHHRYNRTPLSRDEVYEPARERRGIAALRYYFYILGGLYIGELALNVVAWLPRATQLKLLRRMTPAGEDHPVDHDVLARQCMLSPSALRRFRVDALLTLTLWGTAFWLWRDAWGWLVALLAIRALLVSLIDNAAHYDTPLDDRGFAWNLRLPRALSALMLHFNLHRTHHQRPALPWHALPSHADRIDGDPAFGYAVLAQLAGPLPVASLERKGPV